MEVHTSFLISFMGRWFACNNVRGGIADIIHLPPFSCGYLSLFPILPRAAPSLILLSYVWSAISSFSFSFFFFPMEPMVFAPAQTDGGGFWV